MWKIIQTAVQLQSVLGQNVLWCTHLEIHKPSRFSVQGNLPISPLSSEFMLHAYIMCVSAYISVCVGVRTRLVGVAAVGECNKWRQTWTSISVITRRAEQRQWQTSAWGPSIYETGHASNRKTPHTVMAGGQSIQATYHHTELWCFAARSGENVYNSIISSQMMRHRLHARVSML